MTSGRTGAAAAMGRTARDCVRDTVQLIVYFGIGIGSAVFLVHLGVIVGGEEAVVAGALMPASLFGIFYFGLQALTPSWRVVAPSPTDPGIAVVRSPLVDVVIAGVCFAVGICCAAFLIVHLGAIGTLVAGAAGIIAAVGLIPAAGILIDLLERRPSAGLVRQSRPWSGADPDPHDTWYDQDAVLASGGMIVRHGEGWDVVDRNGVVVGPARAMDGWLGAAEGGVLIVVASLSAFLGGFVSGFARDMRTVAGEARAEVVRDATRRLRRLLRIGVGRSTRFTIRGQEDGRIIVVENFRDLTDQALHKLVEMELPNDPAPLTWDRVHSCWHSSTGIDSGTVRDRSDHR